MGAHEDRDGHLLARREFLRWAGLALLGGTGLVRCSGGTRKALDASEDLATTDSLVEEALPPLGVETVQGWKGLADLPWFELDKDGHLRCTVNIADAIDIHTHLGFAYVASPKIDLLASSQDVLYLMDCDGVQPKCTVDFEKYLNQVATPKMLERLDSEIAASLSTKGSAYARTHTIPNLLAEMDRMGVKRAVVHAVDVGFDPSDDPTSDWLDAIEAANAKDRLILFASVHPRYSDAPQRIAKWKTRGIRGLKVHPTMQRFAPDDPQCQPLYQACRDHHLPVFYHCGRTGVEPELVQQFAEGQHYVQPPHDYPDVTFVLGHSGAVMDFEAALALAKECKNVYLDVHGQGITHIETMIREVGPDRMMYGTDWPFYPEAAMLARVLHVTRADPGLRRQVLETTAKALLGI